MPEQAEQQEPGAGREFAGERPERALPATNAVAGVGMIVLDAAGRVLLGLAHDGRWELPGGKTDPEESFEATGARELAEETGLRVAAAGVRVLAVLKDAKGGVSRVTAAALAEGAEGEPVVTEPDKIVRWEWFAPEALPAGMFEPSAAVLKVWRPELTVPAVPAHCYPVVP
ncbi:NUDIX hydrolase [Streptomyces sp. NPDC093225]|uniref:nucleotide triphosphate diphosphatase NUDT15 n=1 Tax=Streptomyces sp. NPDC093225 TaxID=3366034 RepID=UPI00380B2F1E